MMERHNRKSHLGPQLSPATRSLLRGDDKSTSSSSRAPTPVSGEIPISASSNGSSTSRARSSYPDRSSSAAQPQMTSTMNLPIRPAPPPLASVPRTARRTAPNEDSPTVPSRAAEARAPVQAQQWRPDSSRSNGNAQYYNDERF